MSASFQSVINAGHYSVLTEKKLESKCSRVMNMSTSSTRPPSCMYCFGELSPMEGTPANMLFPSERDSASRRSRPPPRARFLWKERGWMFNISVVSFLNVFIQHYATLQVTLKANWNIKSLLQWWPISHLNKIRGPVHNNDSNGWFNNWDAFSSATIKGKSKHPSLFKQYMIKSSEIQNYTRHKFDGHVTECMFESDNGNNFLITYMKVYKRVQPDTLIFLFLHLPHQKFKVP